MGTLISVVVLVLMAVAIGALYEKNKRKRKEKPDLHAEYTVQDKTAAACRGLLGAEAEDDLFAYELERTAQGGWYITLREHRPTQQVLSTVFLLCFTGDDPAGFTVDFVSEAFGAREPVVPAELLDSFFAAKLGAVRVAPPS